MNDIKMQRIAKIIEMANTTVHHAWTQYRRQSINDEDFELVLAEITAMSLYEIVEVGGNGDDFKLNPGLYFADPRPLGVWLERCYAKSPNLPTP